MAENNEATVKQKHVRILREALAGAHKRTTGAVQQSIHGALLRFALALQDYCTHPEEVFIEKEDKMACLDCGNRRSKTQFQIVPD